MFTWWVRLIIATNIVLIYPILNSHGYDFDKQTPNSASRILQEAITVSGLKEDLAKHIGKQCEYEEICVARKIAEVLGEYSNVIAVNSRSIDERRLAKINPSIKNIYTQHGSIKTIQLDRFGRKAEWEVAKALKGFKTVIIDLRENVGGDLSRMIRVAALFIGPKKNAFIIKSHNYNESIDIPTPIYYLDNQEIILIISRKTASSAELFSILLRRYAQAKLVGEKTQGKNELLKVVPVNNRFRISLPAGEFLIFGEDISDGVLPD